MVLYDFLWICRTCVYILLNAYWFSLLSVVILPVTISNYYFMSEYCCWMPLFCLLDVANILKVMMMMMMISVGLLLQSTACSQFCCCDWRCWLCHVDVWRQRNCCNASTGQFGDILCCLHANETPQHGKHIVRCCRWCYSSHDWLVCCDWHAQRRWVVHLGYAHSDTESVDYC